MDSGPRGSGASVVADNATAARYGRGAGVGRSAVGGVLVMAG